MFSFRNGLLSSVDSGVLDLGAVLASETPLGHAASQTLSTPEMFSK